jgi:apolipoprotein N-acyltransferase
MSRRARLGLAAGYAVVTFLSFPHPVGTRVVDAGAWLSWLGPALLLLALRGLAPAPAARVAFLASLAAHSAILHWIYVVTVVYGHAPAVLGWMAPVGLAVYVAGFGAAFGALQAPLRRLDRAFPFAVAALWTALDWLRSFALTGFPWATLGYAQHQNPALLGLAAFTGVYGLSFVTVLGGAALEGALGRAGRGPRAPRAALAALAGVLVAHGAGLAAPDPDARADRETLRVAVLQGDIDQGVKWSREWVHRTLEIYADLTRRAAGEGAELVVWPETAVPGALEADAALRARIAALATETGTALVVGGVGLDLDLEHGPRASRYYDSAFAIGPSGRYGERYDKTHLVPFGEYVPLRDLLGLLFRAVASGIAPSDVTAGAAPRALTLELPGGGLVRAGVPICFELLFPDLMRRFAGDGAELMLAITNDAWYGRTGAPYQFLAITALRSAETRLWTARAANTGVSAFIDGRGRVRAQTRIFEPGYLVADVPRHPRPQEASFYVRHGDVFAVACALAALVAIGLARWGRAPVRDGAG